MSAIIERELAKSLIKEYQTRNTAASGTNLTTHEGHHLNGFHIDRASLDKMLADPKCTGICVHLAKHPAHQGADNNALTIVLGSTTPNPAHDPANPGAVAPHVAPGDLYEYTDTCPSHCTDL